MDYHHVGECLKPVTLHLKRTPPERTRPAAELGFQNFIASLMAKAIAVAKNKDVD